jgi:hypothetical protein
MCFATLLLLDTVYSNCLSHFSSFLNDLYNAINDVFVICASVIARHLAIVHCLSFGLYLAPSSKKHADGVAIHSHAALDPPIFMMLCL